MFINKSHLKQRHKTFIKYIEHNKTKTLAYYFRKTFTSKTFKFNNNFYIDLILFTKMFRLITATVKYSYKIEDTSKTLLILSY